MLKERVAGGKWPLALACSLGHVGCVEALCLWGRRQRLQIDPTAPQVTPLNLARRELLGVIGWEDIDTSTLGDPPMIMVVRGQGSLEQKLQLISVLCSYNFSVDVRGARDSWTPLLAAVERGSIELVQALVAQGARSSPDSLLSFTPLHLACQMGHWHLVPCLVEAMNKQYRSMSAWGPSPQYVSLNVADVTALDIALLRYFNDESESCGTAAAAEGNGQKAVNVLREFIHGGPADDAGTVCGWELLQVMNLIAIPSKKAMNAQLADCNRMVEGSPNSANADSGEADKEAAEGFNDVREVLEAVRLLVKAGAQTRFLLEDLLEPATNPPVASPIFKSAAQPARTSPKYSLQEGEAEVCETDTVCLSAVLSASRSTPSHRNPTLLRRSILAKASTFPWTFESLKDSADDVCRASVTLVALVWANCRGRHLPSSTLHRRSTRPQMQI
eukprot:s5663_g5.t1